MTLVVEHWVAAVAAVVAVVGMSSVWSLLWVYVELATAMLAVMADSLVQPGPYYLNLDALGG